MLAFIGELIVAVLLVTGAFFLFVGSFALAKLPDLLRRLHGPTKSTTLGIGSLLIASMVHGIVARSELSIHELLITLFLFLTAPVSAHMIAKAHLLTSDSARRNLTPTGSEDDWATIAAPRREES